MKLRVAKPIIVLCIGLFFAACASIDSKDTDQYIFLDKWDLLFIDLKYAGAYIYDADMPDVIGDWDENRRRDFLQVVEELLFEYQLPLETYILDEGEEPKFGPVLEISVLRFEQDNIGDYVATIQARLRKRGELNTLGTYTQRESPPVGGGSHHTDKVYRDVMRKPLQKMMNDLIRHFPSPEEKKILDGALDEPAPE